MRDASDVRGLHNKNTARNKQQQKPKRTKMGNVTVEASVCWGYFVCVQNPRQY